MRICLLTDTFLPLIGGHEIAVDQLALSYRAAGHDIAVLAIHARRRGTPGGATFPYRVERVRKPLSQVWDFGVLTRALLRLHRRWPYEVIHCFSSYPTGFASLKARVRLGVPLVVTSQGGDLAEGSRFSGRPVIMDRIRRTLEESDAVTALSEYMKQRALAIAPKCAGHLHDIPNGVDCAAWTAAVPAGPGPGSLLRAFPGRYLLFLGRLHPRKGVDVLIDAFASISDRFPSLQLAIAGDGKVAAALREQAARTGASSRIHFLGLVEGDGKKWLLQNCLCLVAPTRTWEGSPVVVLEAMACGKAVVGSAVGGIVDLIHPDENGLLVPAGDPRALAAALAALAEDDARRSALETGAIATARQHDWPLVANRYLLLFQQLLKRTS